MSSSETKKKRKSRKNKEEKLLEKIAKEQAEQKENQENEESNENRPFVPATPEQQQLMQNPEINQKMMDMDVRIKYGFIKTLHNNLMSINRRMNWDPNELVAIGMIFRDLQNIELTVFNTVMKNEEEEDEEGEEEPEEETEEIN
jgi:hypothetical protein